jgi:transposase
VSIDPNNPATKAVIYPERHSSYVNFEKLIGICYPFYINDYKLDEDSYESHLFVTYHSKLTFTSPCCGVENCKIHSKTPRVIRDLDLLNSKAQIHIDVPRISCPKCGKIVTLPLPWVEKGSGLTVHFEQKVIAYAEFMPFTAVAKLLNEKDTRLSRIVNRKVDEARQNLDWSEVNLIGVDETSKAKGHDYISTIVDMDKHKVLFVTDGKDSSVLGKFSEELERNKGNPLQIEEVTIDMSPAFILGVNTEFHNASITFDRFHVMKLANQAVDQVRRAESRITPILKGTKYLWLYNPENLTDSQREDLTKLSKRNLKTARAYRFKLALQHIYTHSCTPENAEYQLKKLINWGKKSRLEPLINFANTLQRHLCGVLRFFISHLTSGAVEGINGKIQEVKRRSRGFPNVDHFKNMIYLTLGGLVIQRLYSTGKATV